jgi:hypothetical protein
MAIPIQNALGVADLDTLLKLRPDSEIPRVNRGIYFCDDAGNGQPRWAQYLDSSGQTVDDENIYWPRDSGGSNITDEGKWILFEAGSSGGGGSSNVEIIQTLDGPLDEDPPTYGYNSSTETFTAVGISFMIHPRTAYGSFSGIDVYIGIDPSGNEGENGWELPGNIF